MAVENDIVLIHIEDSPVSFARVEDISPDVKKGWYVIKLFILQVPLATISWILKDIYINGEEFFMDGKKMKLEVVEATEETIGDDVSSEDPEDIQDSSKDQNKSANVISFADLKKKR